MGLRNVLGLTAAALLLQFAAPAPAPAPAADRPEAVVELFTSQGCSSCPPADRLLRELAREGDVVALGYHVDYWDYLGWRDTLASPENTARQQEYNAAFGARSVYTPQAVVNGRAHVNGADRAEVRQAIDSMARRGDGMMVDVSVSYRDDSIFIETGAAPSAVGEAHVVLVYFKDVTAVDIADGKNGGSTIEYWNAVTGFHTAGTWHGEATRIELPLSEIAKKADGGCAVLIQEMAEDGLPGPVIGAAIMKRSTGW